MALTARFGYNPNDVRMAECSASEAVGDAVCIAADPPNGLDIVTKADPSNFNKMPAVGIIIRKVSSTLCVVQWRGETPNLFTGLSSGEVYFVGVDSKLAESPPTPTTVPLFTQFLGVATAPNRFFVRPNDHMVRRI